MFWKFLKKKQPCLIKSRQNFCVGLFLESLVKNINRLSQLYKDIAKILRASIFRWKKNQCSVTYTFTNNTSSRSVEISEKKFFPDAQVWKILATSRHEITIFEVDRTSFLIKEILYRSMCQKQQYKEKLFM